MNTLYRYNTMEWSYLTFFFYLSVVMMSYFLPKIKTKICFRIGEKELSTPVGVLLVELMLIFLKGFSACGTDVLGGYYYNFQSAGSMSAIFDQSLEKGYALLNVIIRNVTNKYWLFLLIVTLITIIPVFKMVRKYSDRIDASAALFLYTSIYFYPGLSLMRITMAASIGLFAFDAMVEKKPLKAFFWIIIASLFHTSVLCLLGSFLMMFAKQLNKRFIFAIVTLVFCFFYLNRSVLEMILTGRHAIYDLSDGRLGMEQFAYHIPIILLLVYQRKRIDVKDSYFYTLSCSYLVNSFFMGSMQYMLPALGRTYVHFLPLCIIVAYYSECGNKVMRKQQAFIKLAIFAYGIFRFFIYISSYYSADGIMPYINLFGWSI